MDNCAKCNKELDNMSYMSGTGEICGLCHVEQEQRAERTRQTDGQMPNLRTYGESQDHGDGRITSWSVTGFPAPLLHLIRWIRARMNRAY